MDASEHALRRRAKLFLPEECQALIKLLLVDFVGAGRDFVFVAISLNERGSVADPDNEACVNQSPKQCRLSV